MKRKDDMKKTMTPWMLASLHSILLILLVLAFMLPAHPAQAGTRTKWIDGPSNQGKLVFYDSVTGVTNLIFGTNGVLVLNLASDSTFTVLGSVILPVNAQTVTNGQAVTLSPGINSLVASGEAALGTNVITFANVDQGATFYVVNNSLSSNKLEWVRTGNWKSADIQLSTNELATIVSTATNALHGIE